MKCLFQQQENQFDFVSSRCWRLSGGRGCVGEDGGLNDAWKTLGIKLRYRLRVFHAMYRV